MLFLKSLYADNRGYNGFLWPDQVNAIVESETWDPTPQCGDGLHGLINGNGSSHLLKTSPDAIWIAFESVDEKGNPADAEAVAIDGDKGKCHRAIIRAVGTRKEATAWLMAQGCTYVHYAVKVTTDNHGTATAGDWGIAVTERYGVAEAKNQGIAISDERGKSATGNWGIAISADYGTATGDIGSITIAGYHGEATTRECGVAITGSHGKATAGSQGIAKTDHEGLAIVNGSGGTALAGIKGVAIVGENGIAAASSEGAVMGGEGSVLILDGMISMVPFKRQKYVAIVGQNGIKPNTRYRLNGMNQFVEVPDGEPICCS